MNPVIRDLNLDGRTPLELFSALSRDLKKLVFLASDGSADSRWSILAWDPIETLQQEPRDQTQSFTSDLPFVGGWIGTINYEGEQEWARYDHALIYDHHEKKWWGVNVDDVGITRDGRITRGVGVETQDFASLRGDAAGMPVEFRPTWNFAEYKTRFDVVHDNIVRGEIYQACLTFPFTGPAVKDPRGLFVELLKKNPAPMAAYIEQSDRTVMSLSPERFISWDGKILETKPIKGTRPRAKMKEEDEDLRVELLQDEKEKAELTMITDLLRNDLAKVSKAGSVEVVEERGIQATPNVWHTYSHIQSQTKSGTKASDIIEAMFPGGSISGCPKKRAMEILKDVEHGPRGIYTGCIGYISDHGRMDLSIAIRTLEQTEEGLKAGFGSGIVYDSKAEEEYQECFDKAKIFLEL